MHLILWRNRTNTSKKTDLLLKVAVRSISSYTVFKKKNWKYLYIMMEMKKGKKKFRKYLRLPSLRYQMIVLSGYYLFLQKSPGYIQSISFYFNYFIFFLFILCIFSFLINKIKNSETKYRRNISIFFLLLKNQ